METIVKEKGITFKDLEKKIFTYACDLAVEMTKIVLESYDKELHDKRNRKEYRDKGMRTTTIKTVYGDVSYRRHVYQTKDEEGNTAFIHLLDQYMNMDRIGLISINLAEKAASCITESSYRATAAVISDTTGQQISYGGDRGTDKGRGKPFGKRNESRHPETGKGDKSTV